MRHNRNLAFGMLMLWGVILSVNILFRHAHRLANGHIVTHVHPYKWKGDKGPLPYNPHTSTELSWLDAQSNAAYLWEIPAPFVFEIKPELNSRRCPFLLSVVPAPQLSPANLRGPPSRLC